MANSDCTDTSNNIKSIFELIRICVRFSKEYSKASDFIKFDIDRSSSIS